MSSRYTNDELLSIVFDQNEAASLREMQLAREILDERGVRFCENCGSRDLVPLSHREQYVLDDEHTRATHECEDCGEGNAFDGDSR